MTVDLLGAERRLDAGQVKADIDTIRCLGS